MRSAVLILFVVALVSGCSSTSQQTIAKVEELQHITRAQFIGKWHCLLANTDRSIESVSSFAYAFGTESVSSFAYAFGTESVTEYKSDGSFSSILTIHFPYLVLPKNSLFIYSFPATGLWELEGNKITENILTQGEMTWRVNKSSPLWDAIDDKKEKELYSIYTEVYEAFSSQNYVGISQSLSIMNLFMISDIEMLTLEGNIDGEKIEGACSKKE